MEKLQPVLKQIFWICTGFVVVIAVSGWWIAIGSLGEQINKNKTTLVNNERDSKSGKDAPNGIFTAGATAINTRHRNEFLNAERDLHNRQIQHRTYPKKLAHELPSFGSPIPETALRNEYRKVYEEHFAEQLRVLDPFIVQDNRGLIDVTIPEITQENPEQWRYLAPTATEIWNAQEDLWLLRSLFQSIAAVNRGSGAERLGKSPIRHLMSLQLRGGSRDQSVAAEKKKSAASAVPQSMGIADYAAMYAEEQAALDKEKAGGPKRTRSSGGRRFRGTFQTDLLNEEFGTTAPIFEERKVTRRRFKIRNTDEDEEEAEEEGGSQVATSKSRYVDINSEYRTRAFLLRVKIDGSYLPSLLSELTNSSYPAQIVRVTAVFSPNSTSPAQNGIAHAPGAPGSFGSSLGTRLGGGFGRGSASMATGSPMGMMGAPMGMMGAPTGDIGGGSHQQLGPTVMAVGPLALLAENKRLSGRLYNKGQEERNSALYDPALVELKIAGLLTLYGTPEENERVEETAEMEREEAEATAKSSETAASEEPNAADTDANSTEETITSENTDTTQTSAGEASPEQRPAEKQLEEESPQKP
ncbi:MAG: hypothetical protein MK110_17035 [Fuerstiella sp.]|nr:hypothetical protein [Fuerstiella sp.]